MKFSWSRVMWRLVLIVVLTLCAIIGTSCSHYNSCPVIENLQSTRSEVAPQESIRIECVASDVDGDTLNYTWLASGGTFSEQSSVSTWQAPVTPGDYTITALVTDGWGGEVTKQLTVSVVIVNNPPIIESLTAKPSVVDQDKSATIECVASDPDGDELEYMWEVTAGSISGEDDIVTWQAPHNPGAYTITVKIDDGEGGKATEQTTVDVIINNPPVIDKLVADPATILQGGTTKVRCVATDPDGDKLEYTWKANGGEISGEGDLITWKAPTECKQYIVTANVTDGRGGEVSQEVTITVRKPG
jgi:hypothetical protein